ncbi:hypothetical protein H5410_026859 [Solanum commersonii]|uniref:Uncharacterized protein n=1 Tax=Solanum commersonii TaxID=4109 RepID=A0A9J5Z0A9_SOLCO|nr:hypothetical protein H5410_026859 [Solanum commersonii]
MFEQGLDAVVEPVQALWHPQPRSGISVNVWCPGQLAHTSTNSIGVPTSHQHKYQYLPLYFTPSLVALVKDDRLGPCLGSRVRGRSGKFPRLRVTSWNTGSLTGKSIKLVKILKKRKINIVCSGNKWVGTKAWDVNRFKLWYLGGSRDRNGVGIFVDGDHREQVVEVRKFNDEIMTIKLVVEGLTLNIISAFTCHKAFELVIPNSCFPKKEGHLVTFHSVVAKTLTYYFFLRKGNIGLCKDCKVMDLEIEQGRRQKNS